VNNINVTTPDELPHSPAPRILVVGPKSSRTLDFITCLERLSYCVCPLSEPRDSVISHIQKDKPDMVFIDTHLTGFVDSFDIFDQIRAQLDIPVLFLCGRGEADQIPDARLSMPFGYLETPVVDKDVRRMVETALHAVSLERRLKITEQARDQAKAGYHLLADNVNDVIFTLDMDLNYTYISPSIKTQRGYDCWEVVGTSIHHMVTPESLNKILALFHEEVQKPASEQASPERSRMLEAELYRKDGTTIWIESKIAFLRDENNQPIGIIGVNRDITDRKNIMTQLQESEAKFRALAEACPFAIMIYQNDYWVYVNPAAEYISGYSREELYQMHFWVVVHPDFQPLVRQRGQKRQAGENAPPAYDFKIVNKAGKDIWVSLAGGGLIYGGKPAGLITVIDINERKQAEAALRESEEKYRTILASIEDGYYEVDLSGRLIFFNDMLCRISGYTREEIAGVHYRQYMDEENAAKILSIFKAVFETRQPARACEFRLIQKDGSYRYLEISVSLVQDASGQVKGFQGIIRDINDRKQAEEQRAKLEVQLQHAQKMEAIGTLAGGIAHDFNNILQGINGYTQLLLLKKTEDHSDYFKLTQIQQAGDRAARLIDQLLTFSRKMEGHRCALSLNHEIRQAEQILRQTVPKMITIELNLENDLRTVYADPIHIEQILLNLGSNAADAMEGCGRLTIETRNINLDDAYCKMHLGATPGEYVLLTVSDTGCGMEPGTVAHIFDPFFTTKGVGKGTGLGLASVYGIVKSHGGYITCYTEPGQGTVFKIYLPAISQPEEIFEPVPSETILPSGSETILVVDDEAPIREAAAEMLTYFGYAVIGAENGETALDIFRNQPNEIDLVIMDLSMPGMGGYQCLEEILALNPNAKIIISSGYATQGNAREAMQYGAAGFIGKPYQLTDFITKVRAVLDGGS
jgi:PAS domain S-box-containing protein